MQGAVGEHSHKCVAKGAATKIASTGAIIAELPKDQKSDSVQDILKNIDLEAAEEQEDAGNKAMFELRGQGSSLLEAASNETGKLIPWPRGWTNNSNI